jgi:hypothetical protein
VGSKNCVELCGLKTFENNELGQVVTAQIKLVKKFEN